MLDSFLSLINKFGGELVHLLPTSPFHPWLVQFSSLPYLGFLNWFIPVGTFVRIGIGWLGSIGLFYLYSIIMRWLKVIGD